MTFSKAVRFIERLYFKTLAWMVPLFVMWKTFEFLIPFEAGHSGLARISAILVFIPMLALGSFLEKLADKYLDKKHETIM